MANEVFAARGVCAILRRDIDLLLLLHMRLLVPKSAAQLGNSGRSLYTYPEQVPGDQELGPSCRYVI